MLPSKLALIRPLAVTLLCAVALASRAQVSVTTYHNDNSRTAQNTRETMLTPANVNSTTFGKLFSVPVDGAVYAQPLYLAQVSIGGGTHNVIYAATEHDSLYAIDADSGTVYRQVSLIPAGGATVNSSTDLRCADLVPEVGITGTPVIDPSSRTLYVVAKAKVSGAFVQQLHALDVATLAEKFGGPITIQAMVPGSGYDANGGAVTFNAKQEHQRAALLLENGHVVIAWGAHCDYDPWHGWIMSYAAGTLVQEAAFNTSPNGSKNGIWLSGSGAASDEQGNLYFATGNGSWNGTSDFGDSIVKVGAPSNGSFPVRDYFTPYNQASLASGDADLGSGGLLLLPPLASGKQLLAQWGKDQNIYLLDTNNMGKYCPNLTPPCSNSNPQIVQQLKGGSGVWGSPAYWNGRLYWVGANDAIKAYSFNANNSGLLSTSPISQSAQIFAFAAPVPAISSNGNSNAILWGLDGSADDSSCGAANCLGLFAYDATDLSKLLYRSTQAPNNRDSAGAAVKFTSPIIANGKVYVGTLGYLIGYGLLSEALPVTATPTLQPAPGSYGSAQDVVLADSTTGATIYYTTDGTSPTLSSMKYTAPLHVASTQTIEAIAAAGGHQRSALVKGTYVIGSSAMSVSLSARANVDAIVADGASVPNGGLSYGFAYSANLLGSSVNWNGATFALGAAGVPDAVSATSIALPAGNYTTVSLLGTAVNGNQQNQTFVVTYTDGSTTRFTQSLSDWFTPQNYAGESKVLSTAYRVTSNGSTQNGPFYLYGYSFGIDATRTVASITLPSNRNVVILAIDLLGAGQTLTSSNLHLIGGASASNGVLTLTDGGMNEARAAWSSAPFNVQRFTTDFNFQTSGTADGFAFVLQNAGATALGKNGGGLGYQGIGSSVAVKFDLYSNSGEGTNSTGFYVNGAAPTTPALNMSSVSLHSGDVLHAHLAYDGTTLSLTITDTQSGASFSTSKAINIPSTLGGNSAYAGFTAGTGSLTATQQILSWTYGSAERPVNYPSGFSSTSGLSLVGVTLANDSLQLTDGGANEARSVWTQAQVNVEKFTTDFSFQESAATADGFTFTLQNAAARAVGAAGGGLGYQGIGASVAIKFDLYSNAGEGTNSTGFYVDGAAPTVPALNLTGINLHSGDLLQAHVVYDGTALSLTLTDAQSGASFSASKAINIPGTVGGNNAYAGFTAGTGGASAVQQLKSWTYLVN